MRKIILSAIGTVIGIQILSAGPISPSRALDAGRNILSGTATRSDAIDTKILWDGESSTSTAAPALYVITREGGGFVILSADDNVRPVLAISENGRFETENMPENVKWWMERMKTYVRTASLTPSPIARKQWAQVLGSRADAHITDTVTDKVEHLTPEWDQGNSDNYYFGQQVFNKYCPLQNGQLTITGCVATAFAELLTTLSGIYPDQMPAKGTGTVGGYSPANGFVSPSGYELTTEYDWAGLRSLTGSDAIRMAVDNGQTTLLDNLGHLLADCGAIVQAYYSTGSTSANSGSISAQRMAEHMFTSKTAHSESADDYKPSRWKAMLKEQLAERPVLYSGQSPYGGHAFVFDGYGRYMDDDVFHVNFGWSGYCNGYYFHDRLDTGDGDDYSSRCTALFDFFPDALQQTTYPKVIRYLAVTTSNGLSFCGITAPSGISESGSFTEMYVGGIQNAGLESYSGSVELWKEDKDGNRIGDAPVFSFSRESNPLKSYYYTWYTTYSDLGEISFGAKVAGYYSTDEAKTVWERIKAPSDGTIVEELPLTPGAFIMTESAYSVGDSFVFRLKNYGDAYAGTQWTFTDPDGVVTTLPQAEYEFTLTKAGKYKVSAAIAPAADAAAIETVVTFITVR